MDRNATPDDSVARGAAPACGDAAARELASRIDRALPQTQCTRCGYPDCRGYAQAIAAGEADINRCPPGGAEGIRRLALVTGRPARALEPERGREGPRLLAVIDESWCIGCTLCIKACPVDCIVGAPKLMHVIVDEQCTGCELCVPACPVDCIAMVPVTGASTGWQAWSPGLAEQARARYAWHQERVARDLRENDERLAARAASRLAEAKEAGGDAEALARKRAVIEAALQRAQARAGLAQGVEGEGLHAGDGPGGEDGHAAADGPRGRAS